MSARLLLNEWLQHSGALLGVLAGGEFLGVADVDKLLRLPHRGFVAAEMLGQGASARALRKSNYHDPPDPPPPKSPPPKPPKSLVLDDGLGSDEKEEAVSIAISVAIVVTRVLLIESLVSCSLRAACNIPSGITILNRIYLLPIPATQQKRPWHQFLPGRACRWRGLGCGRSTSSRRTVRGQQRALWRSCLEPASQRRRR